MSYDCVPLLPYDILGDIFLELTFRERIRCTRVSKTWRHFLLSWPSLWRDISDNHCDIGSNLKPYAAYFSGRHVRTVNIVEYSIVDCQKRAVAFLINQECSSIQTMDIPCRVPAMIPPVLSLIQFTGERLLHLTLRCGVDVSLVGAIMHYCPNLRVLLYHHQGSSYISEPRSSLKPLPTRPLLKLTELVLNTPIHMPELSHILSLVPNLRRVRINLGMNRSEFGTILTMIDQSCPFVSQIQLGGTYLSTASFAELHGPGFRELTLETIHGISDRHLVPLVRKHYHTLEILHIRSCHTLTSSTMSALAMLGCPQLRDLRINFLWRQGPGFNSADLCAFIKSAPLLETVLLYFSDNVITEQVLEAIGQLAHLRVLGLQGCCCNDIASETLVRFMQRDRVACPIEKLHLPGLRALTDPVLDAITDRMAHMLVSLDIERTEHITDGALKRFTDRAVGHCLSWLNVSQCPRISPQLIKYARDRLGSDVKVYG